MPPSVDLGNGSIGKPLAMQVRTKLWFPRTQVKAGQVWQPPRIQTSRGRHRGCFRTKSVEQVKKTATLTSCFHIHMDVCAHVCTFTHENTHAYTQMTEREKEIIVDEVRGR